MKVIPSIFGAFLILAGASSGFAQTAPKPDPYAAEYDKLYQAYNKDLLEYDKPYRLAKTNEERAKVKYDPAKNPGPRYASRFLEFAKRAGRNTSAFQAYQMSVQCATMDFNSNNGVTEEGVKATIAPAMDAMLGMFLESYTVDIFDEIRMLRYMVKGAEGQKLADGWEAKIAQSKNAEVQVTYLDMKAGVIYDYGRGDVKKARAMYEEILAKYPKTEPAERAKAQIYELDHFSVGMTAPDFTASDQDGASFKLSDYRGRVVMLDFWGFW